VADVRRWLPRLAERYRALAVATSPPTAASIVCLLARAGVWAGTPRGNARGPLYRLALRRALAHGGARVHYLDFDRALHWIACAPRELAAVLRAAASHPVLLLGRTTRAHRSHHRPLYATESVANTLLAQRLGLEGRVDFLVPSFVLTAAEGARLLADSRARGNAVYGEWAALVMRAPAVGYLECRGLEWETPDRHRRAVGRLGLAEWRRRQDTPAEWRLRTSMAADIVANFTRTRQRLPPGCPRLHRLPPRGR
jgi:hypothetical protein